MDAHGKLLLIRVAPYVPCTLLWEYQYNIYLLNSTIKIR